MTVPGVARHVPGTQPHTSGDLGGEGGGGERPTTHTSAHTARGARAVASLWPGPRPSTRSHADRLSSTQQLAWWRGRGEDCGAQPRHACTHTHTHTRTHARAHRPHNACTTHAAPCMHHEPHIRRTPQPPTRPHIPASMCAALGACGVHPGGAAVMVTLCPTARCTRRIVAVVARA